MPNSLKDELKRLAEELHLDYFGVAPVERFNNITEACKPTDFLPKAKSVIVIGIRIPDSAIIAHKRTFEGAPRHNYYTYTRFGYKQINRNLDVASFFITDYIEKNSPYIAYPVPAAEPRDEKKLQSALSNRYAAVAAGLAQFGYSGFAVTPEDGPRVRWNSIITEAELEPDPLMMGEKLCDPVKCGMLCTELCPVKALSKEDTVMVKIGEMEDKYAVRNKVHCRCATYGLVKGTPGRLQADMPEQMETMDDWYALNKKNVSWQRSEFMHGNYCHKCMVMCPIGTDKK